MAEAPKKEAPGFDPFSAVSGFVSSIYKWLETFIDTSPTKGVQMTPYYIAAVFAYFFFAWMPMHAEATAVWFPIFTALIPFMLPALLYILAHDLYYEYMRERQYYAREYCLLEIKLPEDITQTPYAMELVLRAIYQTGEVDTGLQEILGATKAWFSLEIVSTEGRVRFFMWGRRNYKELMENQIYAHYPTVQVVEVEDYTLQVPFNPSFNNIWGTEQRLQKPDPYPILTYKEFGTLEVTGSLAEAEQRKQDPMASIIESFGSIGEGEHLWMQIIIRAHEPAGANPPGYCPWALMGANFSLHRKLDLQQWAKIEVDKIIETVKGQDDRINFQALTKMDREQIEAIQSKINKQPFDCGIRSLYIANHDRYRGSPRVAIPSALRSFEHGSSGRGLNGLAPIFWIGPFNFPWQDFRGIRRTMLQRRFYNAFVTRQFFWMPHRHPWIVLNSEEIATLYHFPGRVVATPNLERMPSRRAEAPANLPV
jgi:hypothetical protein